MTCPPQGKLKKRLALPHFPPLTHYINNEWSLTKTKVQLFFSLCASVHVCVFMSVLLCACVRV